MCASLFVKYLIFTEHFVILCKKLFVFMQVSAFVFTTWSHVCPLHVCMNVCVCMYVNVAHQSSPGLLNTALMSLLWIGHFSKILTAALEGRSRNKKPILNSPFLGRQLGETLALAYNTRALCAAQHLSLSSFSRDWQILTNCIWHSIYCNMIFFKCLKDLHQLQNAIT